MLLWQLMLGIMKDIKESMKFTGTPSKITNLRQTNKEDPEYFHNMLNYNGWSGWIIRKEFTSLPRLRYNWLYFTFLVDIKKLSEEFLSP